MEDSTEKASETPSDEVLIRQFKDGSMEAFNTLYRRHLPSVFGRVRYVVPAQDVEDVTQEVFIAVLKSLSAFRGAAKFSTWLRTLTNHKVAEFYRKRGRKQEAPVVGLAEALRRGDASSPTIMEDRVLIQRALQKLPTSYREVILLRFAEDMQFNEISEVTGQNLEAVKSMFRRAIVALRTQLET
jgi:RNA polymerase sigma-70 factor (ECF subfamily)